MATTSNDPREIEADLDRERAALASTLDTLSDRVSVDNLAKEALGMLKGHAGTATSTIDHAVRANPLAVALIGAGIAWMFLGPKVSSSKSSDQSSGYGGGLRHDDGGWAATGSRSADYGRVGYVPSDNDDDHSWSREATGLRAKASAALQKIEQEAKHYYESLKNALPGSSSSSQDRDFDAERQSVISSFTNDLRSRLSSGLDSLPEGSRERIVAAREKAYGAMLRAERTGRDVVRDPTRALEEHPLVAGAVAFALGAAVAAVLPGTEAENRAFGSERDRLMGDASRLLREERSRAMQLAGSLGQEVKAAAQETVEAVTDTVTKKASDAANRVGDRASQEFRNGQGASAPSMAGPGDPVIG
ncbi:DUF3618 domain-containing protein [Rubellimicrobium aerolatum]|uniref:DUF3618 domain-containing protein n=1 Tax=Rubellimicrobium aerolatum TaxID=490979 RepID=A0ABW0SG40_9RHOB|nr:DUF3618 domain-containing protein [Rubellimicrobium aerolatum]MBP1806421.1 hypothetical protein [Rubellimicrobium aerolatum]